MLKAKVLSSPEIQEIWRKLVCNCMSEVVVEKDDLRIVIRSLNGGVREEDAEIVLKAVEAIFNGSASLIEKPGNGLALGNGNNGNGDNKSNKRVYYSPWLLAWIAEANGYRDYHHIVFNALIAEERFSKRK